MDGADLLERNIRTMLEASSRKVREEAAVQLQLALNGGSLAPEQERSILGAYLTRFRDPSEAMRLCVIEIVRGAFPTLVVWMLSFHVQSMRFIPSSPAHQSQK